MQARLLGNGNLELTSAFETRIIGPTHSKYVALMQLYHVHARKQFAAARTMTPDEAQKRLKSQTRPAKPEDFGWSVEDAS